jgi:putative redox-active protein with C_GCAxxG_C_C motif
LFNIRKYRKMNIIKSHKIKRKIKRTFLKKGTCSRLFFYLINREYDSPMDEEEKATDNLAGGIMQQGYQCGMLWGASMALGAESYKRCKDKNQAISLAILSTQHVMRSFINRTSSADCIDITNCDWSKKSSIAKYFFSGKVFSCLKLAEKWAPEAILAAEEGLSVENSLLPKEVLSCATQVVKKMGATDSQSVIVAGFAGGMGLSGNGCGALSAAIWMNSMEWNKENPDKSGYPNPKADNTLEVFLKETDYKFKCSSICGKTFKSIDEHTEFLKNGGCEKLINKLAE